MKVSRFVTFLYAMVEAQYIAKRSGSSGLLKSVHFFLLRSHSSLILLYCGFSCLKQESVALALIMTLELTKNLCEAVVVVPRPLGITPPHMNFIL